MGRLKPNQGLLIEGGSQTCSVLELLGEGGQGEVYRVAVDGGQLALKWYFRDFATAEQRKSLNNLVKRGSPSQRFLWPIALVTGTDHKGLGYLMGLRGGNYEGIGALLKGRIAPSFKALCTAGMQLSYSYSELHSRGLCYRDISLGNAFLEPGSGDILICDNDNVTVNKSGGATILGTPRFIAPEVVRGEAMPSTQTDLFSLSVLLFYFFMLHHPFEGKKDSQVHCLDSPAMDELYGRNPVFIFDPNNHSNEPDPRYHKRVVKYWNLYPKFLRDQFIRAFTDGVRDPERRVRESEWRWDMVRLQDGIVYCTCGAENFYDNMQSGILHCWEPQCGKQIPLPFRIRIQKQIVTLNHDRQLYPHHLDGASYDFSQPVATITENPKAPGLWGLKNLTGIKWVAGLPDGTMRDIEPGRSIALKTGTKIYFGNVEGEIQS